MSDNQLSLNPNDFPDVADWQDGQEYTMTVKLKQTAPGKFEVTEATPVEAPEEGDTEGDDEGAEAEPPPAPVKAARKLTGNPAVDKMM